MFRIQSNIQSVVNRLKRLGTNLFGSAEDVLWMAAQDVRDAMGESGEAVTYPVQWDSEKQRRAFFATNGFGNGIPYQRKGTYESSWVATKVSLGAEIGSNSPAARYVGGSANPGGPGQSRIHRGRWKLFRETVDARLRDLPRRVIEQLRVVVVKSGFKGE
jgi:hypothetical protein